MPILKNHPKMHRIIFFFFGRKEHVAAGVQPDMVVFTKDGNNVLSADEGELRGRI